MSSSPPAISRQPPAVSDKGPCFWSRPEPRPSRRCLCCSEDPGPISPPPPWWILVPGRGHPVPVRPGPCPRAAAVDVRTGLVHSQDHHGSRRSGCRCPSGDRIRPAAQDPARITSGCKGPAPRGFNDLTLTPFLARVRHFGAVRWRADPRARRPGHIRTHPFPVLLRSTRGPFRGVNITRACMRRFIQ